MTHTTNPDNQCADLDNLRAALVELTPAQQAAVEALAVGSTHAVAAEASGVARETVTRWARNHPAFRAALNLYLAALVAEHADTARRIRGRALAVVESGLDTADVPTALNILRAIPAPPADAEGMTEPSAILDAETRHTRANLPPVSLPRDEFGFPDVLAGMAGPTEDERAAELTVTRLATAAGLDRKAAP